MNLRPTLAVAIFAKKILPQPSVLLFPTMKINFHLPQNFRETFFKNERLICIAWDERL